MTRETKIGMVVASSFLALVGVVVANKLKKPADAKDDPAAQQWITPKDTKVADATKPENKEKKPETLPAAFLTDARPPLDLPPANGNINLPMPPSGLPDMPGLPGVPAGDPKPPLSSNPPKDNGFPAFPPLTGDSDEKIRQTLIAQAEASRKKDGVPPLPTTPDLPSPLPPVGSEKKDPPKDNSFTLPPFGSERKDPPTTTGTPPLPPVPGVEPKDTTPPLPPFGSEKKDLPPVGTGATPLPPGPNDKKDPPLPLIGSGSPPLPPIGSGSPPLPPLGSGSPPLPPIGSGSPLPPVTTSDNLPPLGKNPTDNLPPIGSSGLPPITTDRKDPPLPPIGGGTVPPLGKPSVDAPVIGKSPDLPPLGSNPLPPIGTQPLSGFTNNPPQGDNLPRVNSFDFTTYKCQPEDTSFDALSNRHYKTTKYAKALELYNANHPLAKDNLRSLPPKLYPGGDVYIPAASTLESKYASAINDRPIGPAPIGPGPVGNPPVVGLPTVGTPTPLGNETPAAGDGVRAYQVPAGKAQMIYEVAQQTLGNPVRWSEIYRLNPTIRPDQPIPPGTTLRVPVK